MEQNTIPDGYWEDARGCLIPVEQIKEIDKARDELGWTAEYGIEEMCASSWKWQSMNPNGYKG